MRAKRQLPAKFWRIEELYELELMKITTASGSSTRHWHDAYNIDVIESGSTSLKQKGTTHAAGQGSLLLLNPQEIHAAHHDRSSPILYRSFYFKSDLIHEVADHSGLNGKTTLHFRDAVVHDPDLSRTLINVHRLFESERDRLRAHSLLLLTLAQVIRRHSDDSQEMAIGKERKAIDRAKAFIHERYREDISLSQIAFASGLSPFYFLRCFRETTGLPPFEYVINLRIETAKQLLRGGNRIADVALASGFYDQSHFTNYFKRIVGVTPRIYQDAVIRRPR